MAKKKTYKHDVFGELHVLVEDDGAVLFLVQDIVRILDVSFECVLTASCFIVRGIYEYSFKTKDGGKMHFSFMDERLVNELTDCPAWRESEQRKWLLETVLIEAKK